MSPPISTAPAVDGCVELGRSSDVWRVERRVQRGGPSSSAIEDHRSAGHDWADGMVTTISSPSDPWALSISSFHWASNKTALDDAVLLLVADSVKPNAACGGCARSTPLCPRTQFAGEVVCDGARRRYRTDAHDRTVFQSWPGGAPGVGRRAKRQRFQSSLTPPSQGQRGYVDQLPGVRVERKLDQYDAPLVFVTALLGLAATSVGGIQ